MTMMSEHFEHAYRIYRKALLEARMVDVGSWHGQSTQGNPMLVTMELPWTSFNIDIPPNQGELDRDIRPNQPWAEQHFQERVGGDPVNPPPSHIHWPWAHGQHQTGENEVFSHTYPERMWPKFANIAGHTPQGRQIFVPHIGIRFEYGDLGDLVTLLASDLYTRQAYLPIFFPEDTGGSMRIEGRLPCSLGYFFMVRNDTSGHPIMDCMYPMRSCDFVRHFRDDIYMAGRLLQWVAMEVSTHREGEWDIRPGNLRVHIASLHAMEGDRYRLTTEEERDGQWQESGTEGHQTPGGRPPLC